MKDQTDSQLLRAYAELRSEPAFAEMVRRHIDLVYSAALRMVCDSHLAEDVTQGVFVALAKNATQLTDRPVLSGWLHRTAQNIAAQTVRTDVRRRVREQEAAAMNELLSSPSDLSRRSGTEADVWEHIAPQLDAALGELNDGDRDALMLRYFERKSAREMAQTLGTSEDAAQKRVSRAVERLREFFTKRGVTVGASGLVVVISANAVQAAPVGLAITISTSAALAATSVATTATVTTAKAIAMTTLQKSIIGATLVAAVGTAIFEARQTSRLRDQIQTHQQQQVANAEQIERLTRGIGEATARQATLQQENDRLQQTAADLPKLRGEVARLRTEAQESARLKATGPSDANAPFESTAKSWLARVNLLKERVEQRPEARIPEFQFLTEEDWLNVARRNIGTETEERQALSALRHAAESRLVSRLQPALRQYLQANNSQFPTDLSQLQPYFESPVDEVVLQRWKVAPADEVPNVRVGGDWIVTQRSPVDKEYDSRMVFGPYGNGGTGFNERNMPGAR